MFDVGRRTIEKVMKKTILVINKFCPLHPKAGGAEKNLLEIFSRIGERHNVYLLTAMFPGAKREEIYRNIHIYRFGNPDSENVIRIHLLLPFLLKNHLKAVKPDILFEDISVLPFFTPLLYPKQNKVVMIHAFNRKHFFKSQRFFFALIAYIVETLFLLFYRREKVIVISEWMKQELLKWGFENVHKVLNGVDDDFFSIRKEYAPKPTVLFLARLESRKGIDLFLKTFPFVKEKIPAVKYIIAGREFLFGSRRLLKFLKKYKENYSSEEIEFLGYVSEDKKQELFKSAWLYVVPSRIEGYGISVLEANATGTFVIANDAVGLKESVLDGKTGILVDCYNPFIFAEKITEWLNREKLKPKENLCREWAKKHNWDESTRHIESLTAT